MSYIADALLDGAPIPVDIIDAHAHLMGASSSDVFVPWATPTGMVDAMDRYGITTACISGVGCGDQNDEVRSAIEAYPDRFIGFHLVNPRYPDLLLDELTRSFSGSGFLGIGEVHPTTYQHDYPVTGPNYEIVWDFAEEHRLPVLIHSGPRTESHRCHPRALGAVARSHPNMNVLIGHCGGYDSWDLLDDAVEEARTNENVYLEICAMGRHFGVLEYLVQRLGGGKVVYGSDAPFHDWSAEIAHVALARVPDDVKECVFSGTMKHLLKEVR